MARRSFSDLLKIFDGEISQNKPNMIHNLLDICNEGCDLKRFMGEPVCKKCEAEPSIMSLIVPPEGIARNPKTRPTGKTWSEEKIVWKADTRGVQKNPRRFGFTERDVATKKFYKLKGSQPGSVTFRLGEDMNPYIIHDNYKNLSAEEREKWIKVKPLHEILKKDEWRLGERGKEYAREYRKNVQQVLATKKKREAKAKEEGLEEHRQGSLIKASIEESREWIKQKKVKALAGETTRYNRCPGELQEYCNKIKSVKSKLCIKCQHVAQRGQPRSNTGRPPTFIAKDRYRSKYPSKE